MWIRTGRQLINLDTIQCITPGADGSSLAFWADDPSGEKSPAAEVVFKTPMDMRSAFGEIERGLIHKQDVISLRDVSWVNFED